MTISRLLVTGSRTWEDLIVIRNALVQFWSPETVLVPGGCPKGADAQCESCWGSWGGLIERHPAEWRRYGKSAGFRRNEEMILLGADRCLAFIRDYFSSATHTATLAQAHGIPTLIYRS